MPQLWPYKPLTGLKEFWQYNTDVLRSHDKEQRLSLRPGARRSFEIDHVLDSYQYASAQEIVRRYEDYYFPDWTQRIVISVSQGTDVVIPIDTTCFDFGSFAVLWRSPGSYEVLSISSSSSDGLIADVLSDWTNVYLMPCWPAVLPEGMSISRLTKTYARVSLQFDITVQFQNPVSTYTQYRGIDVMTDCPLISSGLEENLAWPVERVDNDIGQFFILRDKDYPDATYSLRWRLASQCAQQAMRRWLDSRLGRLNVFWISSRGKDFELATAAFSFDTTLTIVGLIGVAPLARTDFNIEVVLNDNTTLRYQVVNFALGAGSTLVLSLNSTVGQNFAISDVARISNLRLVRFNADRFEFAHNAVIGAHLSSTVVEVPIPDSASS